MSASLADAAPLSPTALALRRFLRNGTALVAAAVVVLAALLAVFAPWIAPQDPTDADLFRRLCAPAWAAADTAAGYWLGCDSLGRDILSRLIHGARVSLSVAAMVVCIAAVIGTLAGLAAGYFGGWVDALISRLVDTLLGFPYLVFAIGLMAMMGPGLHNIVLALVLKEWIFTCRVVRGETLAAREQDYVEAARALGCSPGHIMLREILPNVLSPVLVVATFRMAYVIIMEASLSFLGLGVQPPTPSWGSMVSDGREFLVDAWWVSTLPGLCILALVLSINLASQGLRDAFDPRLHQSS
ncbi:ABC transporter permease [Falsiroseomonas oryziterrae]|uniref:ABC transporter permease n=1 Tax=Falsiroseomonas oryziterrae TaxID=2911368 RepID=UPI001F479BA7|nr:ABC transporter permease [Roseomonas sp. NPKOSM-4]